MTGRLSVLKIGLASLGEVILLMAIGEGVGGTVGELRRVVWDDHAARPYPMREGYYRVRYSLDHDLTGAQYTVAPRPRSCEFWVAPVGDKACRVVEHVETLRVKRARAGEFKTVISPVPPGFEAVDDPEPVPAGRRMASTDGGKTWFPTEDHARPAVHVRWEIEPDAGSWIIGPMQFALAFAILLVGVSHGVGRISEQLSRLHARLDAIVPRRIGDDDDDDDYEP